MPKDNIRTEKPGRDYSVPQGCPTSIEPHMPDTCGDPEHAILAMTDDEYARHRASLSP